MNARCREGAMAWTVGAFHRSQGNPMIGRSVKFLNGVLKL
jgi:hypothetical protein